MAELGQAELVHAEFGLGRDDLSQVEIWKNENEVTIVYKDYLKTESGSFKMVNVNK